MLAAADKATDSQTIHLAPCAICDVTSIPPVIVCEAANGVKSASQIMIMLNNRVIFFNNSDIQSKSLISLKDLIVYCESIARIASS